MEKDIRLDVANETARRYGETKPDFAKKMAARIRRKFAIQVAPEEIAGLALHYKQMYSFAASILKEHLRPSNTPYAETGNVDFENFLSRISKEFPEDDIDLLRAVCGWVVYYEYLR